MHGDDEERLLARQLGFADALSRGMNLDDQGSVVIVGKTTHVGTYPTAAGSYFWVIPQTIMGAEVEGGPGTLTAAATRFLALNLGSQVPPEGTTVECSFTPYRYTFTYG